MADDDHSAALGAWLDALELRVPLPDCAVDLANGVHLSAVLVDVDPDAFAELRDIAEWSPVHNAAGASASTSSSVETSWIVCYNHLKRVHRAVARFMVERLAIAPRVVDALVAPNLTLVAKGGGGAAMDDRVQGSGAITDTESSNTYTRADMLYQLSPLLAQILYVATQSARNQVYVECIQALPESVQHGIMLELEGVVASVVGDVIQQVQSHVRRQSSVASSDAAPSPTIEVQMMSLENEKHALAAQLEQARIELEEARAETERVRERWVASEESLSKVERGNQADVSNRQEIDRLRHELASNEQKRMEVEHFTEEQNAIIVDLRKKLDEANLGKGDAAHFKDQLDEYRHAAEKLQKAEATIEKYKKKLDESADLRRQIRSLEVSAEEQTERYQALDDEYKKLATFKPLMDSYKQQLVELGSKNNGLQLARQELEFALETATKRVSALEEETTRDHMQIAALEERIQELELGGGYDASASSTTAPHSLGAQMPDDPSTAQLKLTIVKLEKDLQQARSGDANLAATQRVLLLENLLDDAQKLKDKSEQDHLLVHQKNLALEAELNKLRSGKPIVESPEITLQLRSRIAKLEEDLSALRVQLADATSIKDELEKELIVAKSDLSLLGGGRTSDLDRLRSAQEQVTSDLTTRMEEYRDRVSRLEQEERTKMEQINRLLVEKDALSTQHLLTKEALLQQERSNNELRQEMAALQSKDHVDDESVTDLKANVKSAAQKLVQLSEQNAGLHKALKLAKEHILQQERQIADIKAAQPKTNFDEAVGSLQTSLKERTDEVEQLRVAAEESREIQELRTRTKREQRLVLSAWYDMGVQLQRRTTASSGLSQGGLAGDVPSSPVSWLNQQRKNAVERLSRGSVRRD